MYVIASRTKVGVNAPLQFGTSIYTDHQKAVEKANYLASTFISLEYFVMEAISKHSANVTVNVSKP